MPSKLHVQGSAYFAQLPPYGPYLKPIVLLKKAFSTLYHLLLRVIWAELVQGKQTNSLLSALLFLFLCVCSLLVYRFGAFQKPFTIAFLLIWMIERQIAIYEFRSEASRSTIRLHGSDEWLIWDQQLPTGEHNHLKLKQAEIEQITISRTQIYGGVFNDRLGMVWQVHLRLCDATEVLLDEQRQISRAFNEAQSIANQLNVPLTFQHSEGQGKFARHLLDERMLQKRFTEGEIQSADAFPKEAFPKDTFPKTIHVQKTAHQWKISSRWRWISGWLLLQQILEKTGFLLFVLWMSNFMVVWGAMLHFVLIAPDPSKSVFDGISLLMPQWRWTSMLELGFALTVLLVQGARLSFEEHLLLNRNDLTFYRNTKPLAQVPLAAIEATLFVEQPEPVLLIVTRENAQAELASHRVIEVDGLQQAIEFRAMLIALDRGRSVLQAKV